VGANSTDRSAQHWLIKLRVNRRLWIHSGLLETFFVICEATESAEAHLRARFERMFAAVTFPVLMIISFIDGPFEVENLLSTSVSIFTAVKFECFTLLIEQFCELFVDFLGIEILCKRC